MKLKHKDAAPEDPPFTVTVSDTGLIPKIGEGTEVIPVDATEGEPTPPPLPPPEIYPKPNGSWLGETVFMPNQQYHNMEGEKDSTPNGTTAFRKPYLEVEVPITDGVFTIKLDRPKEADLGVYDENVKFLSIDVGLEHGTVFDENVQYRSETTAEYARLYYVTEDVTVSGLGEDDGVRYDLTLKKGWNWVLADKNRTYEKTEVPGEDFKWIPGFPVE